MPIKDALKLDENDKKILLALETNARQSAAQIGKKVRLSKEVVNYRIKKYLSSGIITKFFVIPDFNKLGFITYRVYLQFRASTPKKEEEIVNYIKDNMPCQWLGVCDGRWDVVARISAKDIFEFNNMLNAFLEKYGEFIRQKEVTVQLKHTWWSSTYGLTDKLPDKTPTHEVPEHVETVKFDDKDLLILSILIDEARMPTVEIAKKVGVSPDTINYRIKRLISEGVITKIKSYFNRNKLGYQHYEVFIRFNQQPEEVKRFIDYLSASPECFFISSMVGTWDMQFGIDARSSTEFHQLFGKIKEKFSEVIRDYESQIVYTEYAPNPFRYFLAK